MSDEEAERIQRQMKEIRGAMRHNAETFVDNVQATFNWRTHVAKHPLVTIGVAAAVGYWLVPKGKKVSLDSATKQELKDELSRMQAKVVGAASEGASGTAAAGLVSSLVMPLLLKAATQGGVALAQHLMAKFQQRGDVPPESEEESPHRPAHPR